MGRVPPRPAGWFRRCAEQRGESIVPTGAAAANELGLTTQVPVREVYLTSGPTRKLTVGQQKIELRHAPPWQLVHQGRPAGTAIRALASLGPEHAGKAVALLRKRLPIPCFGSRPILRATVRQGRSAQRTNGAPPGDARNLTLLVRVR
ncbi:MAG: hypothetical protein K2X97_09145 [Mycobacteriaceae bacterium]|nr:hypothetical protein [Mycobacteriaceae bacterium]